MIKQHILILLSLVLILMSACKENEQSFLKIDQAKTIQNFNVIGGTVSVPVNSNNSFQAVSNGEWCTVTVVGQSIKISVPGLRTKDDRTAQITVTSNDCTPVNIHVTQQTLSLNQTSSSVLISNVTPEFSLNITSSVPLTFELPQWIHEKPGNVWSWGTNVYSFIADPYQGTEMLRKGNILVKAGNSFNKNTDSIAIEQTGFTNEAILNLYQLWTTSSLSVDTSRRNLLQKMQDYANLLTPDIFQIYLSSTDQTSIDMEKSNPVLSCYRFAFDHALEGVKNEKVENGTVAIWLFYNMGYVVKTPSGCFGVDINHRWAEKLAPYLDFLCVTHNHADHISTGLMQAMYDAGKPVISNFYLASNKYCSKTPTNYTIGKFSVRTAITDHDGGDPVNFVSVFRIDCGDDSGNFSLLHCGDSSFDQKQFTNVQGGSVSLSILRNGSKAENNIVGTGSGQMTPSNAFLSHIIELRHQIDVSPIRFKLSETLGHCSQINCKNTSMPFWGEKLTWKEGKFN